MATLETGIRLNDMMTEPIRSITNAMNMMLSAWETMEGATAAGFDTSNITAIRGELNHATMALNAFNDAAADMPNRPAPHHGDSVPRPATPPEDPTPRRVQWVSDPMPVFSGGDRFRQEISKANQMMDTLMAKQRQVNETASHVELMPPEAVNDMATMQGRLQAIQTRIQAIESNPINLGSDAASAELEHLRGQLQQAVDDQQELNRAVADMDVSAANSAYLRLSSTVSNTERYIRDNTNEQGEFNRTVNEGTRAAGGLKSMLAGMVSVYGVVEGIKKLVDMSDEFTQTTARLNLMNDGLQTTEELSAKIMDAANRTRSEYTAMASSVASMGTNARSAFSTNDELIAFMEQVNKQFVIGGASAEQQSGAMTQLAQAMGAGALRGDELNSILEAAPGIARAIEQYMGIAEGSIKSVAEEGKVTAEVVKYAMLSMAEETNAQFDSMPMTWSQVFVTEMNNIYEMLQPVMQAINGLAQHWDIIRPIVLGVAAAVGLYTLALLANKAATLGSAAAVGFHNFVETVHSARMAMSTGATFAATAAQYGFNAALYACPITWIILAIIIILAVLYAVITAINKLQGKTISVVGVICGGINVVLATLWNLALVIADIGMGIWEVMKALTANIKTAFHNAIANVQGWFYGLLSTALEVVEGICRALNKLPFVEFDFSGITAKADEYAAKSAEAYDSKGDYESVTEAFDTGFHTFDAFSDGWVADAWSDGYDFGQQLGSDGMDAFNDMTSLDGLDGLGGFDMGDIPTYDQLPSYDQMAGNVGDIADNTSEIADTLDITEEDLKYLRDAAERDTINRFTTAEVTVEMGGVNNVVNQNTDLDGVMEYLSTGVQEALERVAEGVHA